MNDVEAENLARAFLSEKIEIKGTAPSNNLALYNFNAAEEVLFRFQLFGRPSMGSSEYIAVSRNTGQVRYIGHCGE